MKKILILDGDAVMHPHYYKANDDFKNPKGESVGMLYRTFGTIKKFMSDHESEYFSVAFDPMGPTSWRYKVFSNYKPNRPAKTDNFLQQKTDIMELLTAFGVNYFYDDNYESDDIIASLVAQHAEQYEFDIGAQDKDLYVLLKYPNVRLLHPTKMTPFTSKELFQKWGIHPYQVNDFLTLLGDKVDGIAGVEKWGIQTISQALQEYQTLENIIANQNSFTGVQGHNLKSVSHLLVATRNALSVKEDIVVDIEQCKMVEPNPDEVLRLLKKHGFTFWYREMAEIYSA